jgi:DNA-binding NtrC family response regulator
MSNRICLIVDDEPAIRSYLRVILEAEQFHCIEAENATKALRMIQKIDGRLDLVVTDIKTPGDVDGIDLAYSVRNSFPALPVILISGYADEDSVRRAAKAFKLLKKPLVSEVILNVVRAAMAPE